MDPSLPILALVPAPDSIPVHFGWLNFFFILTFVFHLLFMNAMLGCGIIALVRSLRGTQPDLFIAKEISLKLPYTIAFTVNMGVAPLLFIQVLYGSFIYTSSVLMAWYWLLIIGILIIAYYSAYLFDFKFDVLGSLTRNLSIAVCVVLLLVVAFLFTSNITLMLMPEKWVEYFSNTKGTILNFSEPTLIPRYLHFVCASIAIGGLSLAIAGKVKINSGIGKDSKNFEAMISSGMRWFFYATLVQVIIGLWFAAALPRDIILWFMGGNKFATPLFGLGLTCAVALLFFGFKKQIWLSTTAVVITVIVMVLIRDIVRLAYLKPYFALSDLKVEPQYSPMILFIVTLIIGIGFIIYMLKLAAKQKEEV
ncbi:MAG: hypothetical protein K8R67_01260 [Desulfobacteraceae bacterium]|nr:hypothetical protein [Desulfobacteraceae bacterium]